MDCSAKFDISKYVELMDKYMEDQLGNIPCDRI